MSVYSPESRQVEIDGISKLQDYFGDSATVIDLCHTGGHDFEINYRNGNKAIGEISWLVDPKTIEMHKAILKREIPQQLPLPIGWGHWVITFVGPVNINQLENMAPKWISEVLETGKNSIEIYDGWPITELAKMLRAIGVCRVRKVSDEPDQLNFFQMEKAGAVPPELDDLCDSLNLLMEKNSIVHSNGKKLLGKDANEKHIYFRLGSLILDKQIWGLHVDRKPVVIPGLNFPPEITHIWLDSGHEQFRSVLWVGGQIPRYIQFACSCCAPYYDY